MFIIAAFYHFFDFTDFTSTKQLLMAELTRLGIKGSLLIAPEGINGTLAGTREAIDEFLAYLRMHITKEAFEHKESICDRQPFKRAKVRLKKEIISFIPRQAECERGSLAIEHGGIKAIFVEPKDWNRLIEDPDTVVIDARNSYEVHLGTFPGAIDPNIRTFKQLPAFAKNHLDPARHGKIASFCTGGIRCEKFSAWLVEQGFPEVYQLKGGILKYLEEVPAEESRWQGECYVFDERVAVGHGLKPSQTAGLCPACGHALTGEERAKPSCPFCI